MKIKQNHYFCCTVLLGLFLNACGIEGAGDSSVASKSEEQPTISPVTPATTNSPVQPPVQLPAQQQPIVPSVTPATTNSPTQPGVVASLNIQDPLYKEQWYLKNTGQSGGTAGIDINIEPVWRQGYTGKGVKIGVLDDPLQSNHPDLRVSSVNITDYSPDDPICASDPNKRRGHGMNVAGLIAARDNNIGLRGVAFRSTLYGYGVIDGDNIPNFLNNVRDALNRAEHRQIAVYNGSIGNKASEYDPITPDMYQAVEKVTHQGFYGKGSVLVFAAGNGSVIRLGNSSLEALWSNHYATITVNTVTREGYSVENFGGSGGVNLWLGSPSRMGFSGGRMPTTNVICSGVSQYDEMNATSGATPLVSGVVALLREAYPQLTWRDVKLILAESARKITDQGQQYQKTGQMYSDPTQDQKHHRYTGFGLVNAGAALELAKSWKSLPPMKTAEQSQNTSLDVRTRNRWHESTLNFRNIPRITFIESVTLQMEMMAEEEVDDANNRACVGQWDLELVSPDQKKSALFKANGETKISHAWQDGICLQAGANQVRFVSNSFLGSSSITGDWKLRIKQTDPEPTAVHYADLMTEIKNWKITVRGH